MGPIKDKIESKYEMLTEEEIQQISMGVCPWPNMKAPKRPSPQAEDKTNPRTGGGDPESKR